MRFRGCRICGTVLLSLFAASALGDEPQPAAAGRVYGEWRILVRPDKGQEYDRLIETKGLPLFRAAGGRMVGWWKTLVGNLYEHVTIWEYDDMATFEKAIGYLGGEPKFAEFVAERDPLLSGEENRFLSLSPDGIAPNLPEPARFVIHEMHRVPLGRQREYLDYLHETGLPLLKKQGFRPVGPWTTSIGHWTEITLLFRFDSLVEREKLIANFADSDDGRAYLKRISEFADDVSTRLLMPASFAHAPAGDSEKSTGGLVPSKSLRHLQRITPRVFAAGFDDRQQSANCGFFATSSGATIVDLPRGIPVAKFFDEVERLTGKKPNRVLLTHASAQDLAAVQDLIRMGVGEIIVSPQTKIQLLGTVETNLPIRPIDEARDIGDAAMPVRFLPADGTAAAGCAVVELPSEGVLFGGPLVFHGPRTRIIGSDTARWISLLKQLESQSHDHVIPGFGTWGGQNLIVRQRRFLEELRSQVGYAIALGRPPEVLEQQVRISPDFLVWMPYDAPVAEDLMYVYRELTAPVAPFNGREPDPDARRMHALVLIGDGPHEPQHLEQGLRPVFEATGIIPHFTVDVRALSAENLSKVGLLVMLRDGLMRPSDDPKTHYVWMTKDQQRAILEFVEQGGGFLNLHNSLGLYPEEGPYLKLAAGKYVGHGPLERFRVEPVDDDHPITRGIAAYSVADEQHTPVVDLPRVRQLFRSESDSGVEGVAGWVLEPGAGRLCHLANGHTRDALEHPVYQQVLRNALLWCARQPEAGKSLRP
jgi:type 1 glutamine amidotransferase